MSRFRIIAMLANIDVLLWIAAIVVWWVNWPVLFPNRGECVEGIVAGVRALPGETQIPTPSACRGFSEAELARIVAGIRWEDYGLGPAPRATPSPSSSTPATRPQAPAPQQRPSRTPEDNPTVSDSPSPPESPSGSPPPSESGPPSPAPTNSPDDPVSPSPSGSNG